MKTNKIITLGNLKPPEKAVGLVVNQKCIQQRGYYPVYYRVFTKDHFLF